MRTASFHTMSMMGPGVCLYFPFRVRYRLSVSSSTRLDSHAMATRARSVPRASASLDGIPSLPIAAMLEGGRGVYGGSADRCASVARVEVPSLSDSVLWVTCQSRLWVTL